MNGGSTPLWNKYLTWHDVRTWHLRASSLRLSSDSSTSPRPTSITHLLSSVPEHNRVLVPLPEAAGGMIMWLIVLASLLPCVSASDVDLKKLDGLAKARVEVTRSLCGSYAKEWVIIVIVIIQFNRGSVARVDFLHRGTMNGYVFNLVSFHTCACAIASCQAVSICAQCNNWHVNWIGIYICNGFYENYT